MTNVYRLIIITFIFFSCKMRKHIVDYLPVVDSSSALINVVIDQPDILETHREKVGLLKECLTSPKLKIQLSSLRN